MNLQPTLKGDKVLLRPLREEDLDQLYQVASDPLIWELHQNRDRHKLETFNEFFNDGLASNGALIAIDNVTNKVIGTSRYQKEEKAESTVEIGWSFLSRSYWGGEYNGEMKRLMIDHAFRYFENVILYIDKHNIRSQKAALKIGALRVMEPSNLIHQDKDNWSFVIKRDEWKESKLSSNASK